MATKKTAAKAAPKKTVPAKVVEKVNTNFNDEDFEFEVVGGSNDWWKYENEGDSITGIVQDSGRTQKLEHSGEDVRILTITNKTGTFNIPYQKQMQEKLTENEVNRITYEGQKEYKDGKKTKRFNLFKVEKGTKK